MKSRIAALTGTACLALSLLFAQARAAEPEKKDISLAVGSVIMSYMPVGLADATGAFKRRGSTSPSKTSRLAARRRCRP